MPMGDSLPSYTVTYRQADLIRYAAASGDFNPIHYDRQTAIAAGLPGVVVHGMLNMAVLGRYLQSWNQGRFRVLEWKARFRSFVEPGQLVRLEGRFKSEDADRVIVHLSATVDGQSKPAVTAEAVLLAQTS